MNYTDNLLRRLAHRVADFKQASQGVRAREFRSYLDGMRDAVTALGGPADFTLAMHDAYGRVGVRPQLGSVNGKMMKAWEELMVETYRKQVGSNMTFLDALNASGLTDTRKGPATMKNIVSLS